MKLLACLAAGLSIDEVRWAFRQDDGCRGERREHCGSVHPMGARNARDPIDAAIARLADRQYGVVPTATDGGRGGAERDRAPSRPADLLVPLHRGVYAFGHRQLRIEGRWLAAVLAAGPGAVLSHRDAAALHGMRKAPESER